MKFFSKAFIFTYTSGLLQITLPAKSEPPYVYTTGGKLYSSTTECVKEGRRITRASGFDIDEVIYDDNPVNGATIFGSNMYSATAFTFRCETAYGTYSYATSSQDNDTAYEYYQNVIRNDPSEI